MKSLNHRRGLTTVEALVAVALLSIAMAPLLQFQGQIIREHRRIEHAYADATLRRNALVLMRDLNPMENLSGRADLDEGITLSWSSEQLTPTQRGTAYPTGDGPFLVALYRVDAEIERAHEPGKMRVSIERLGWHRSPEAMAPGP